MAEQLTLTVPEVTPQVTNPTYQVAFIGLAMIPAATVTVHLRGQNGERIEVRTDTDAEAQALLTQLNTANLSVKSLHKRVLEWSATKLARLAGTVTGTPA